MAGNPGVDGYPYISAGFHLRALLYTSSIECRWVIKNIKEAIAQLDRLGFTYPRNQFESVAKKLEEVARNSGEKTKTPEDIARELQSIVDCIHDTVKSQAQERRLILLQSSSVSAKLRELAKQGTLNTRQTYLFDETVSNLETGAYRSAVVMGWNLAYDIIRQWVFDDATRRAAFNTELAKIVDKSGKPRFDPVSNYPDFYDLGEKILLDVCKGANLIGGNLYDDLRGYLRQRNNYAHASDSHPTVNQANALIDHLVDAIAKL
jgi:hypothetical protein